MITKDGTIVVRDNIIGNNSGLMGMSLELRNTTDKPNAVGATRDIGIRTIE